MNMTEKMETTCDDDGGCEGVDLNRWQETKRTTCGCRNFPGGWSQGHHTFVESSEKPWNNDYRGSHREAGG